jgi:hypothetical protein
MGVFLTEAGIDVNAMAEVNGKFARAFYGE